MKKRVLSPTLGLILLLTVLSTPVSTPIVHASEGTIDPATGLYIPSTMQETLSASASTQEDISAAITNAINSHATSLAVTGTGNVYALVDQIAVSEFFKPVRKYEGGTINELTTSGYGPYCAVIFGRFSTIAEEQFVDQTVAQLLPNVMGATTYDTIKNVHDYICQINTYSYETAEDIPGYDFRSAFDALQGTSVCSGYALLFQKFMDEMGIPCYIAVSQDHMWNIVQLDGQWYHVDCTNDDQDWGIMTHFLLAGPQEAGYTSWGDITLAPTRYCPE